MNSRACFGCYQELDLTTHGGYHKRCSRNLFGTDIPPLVNFGVDQLEEMAKNTLSRHLGITGVQPKISVNLHKEGNPSHRLVIVGLWGNFILKPPTPRFPDMPVVEDATMHMAEAAGIPVARHGLIRLKSEELAYITKRFDREVRVKKIRKTAVEDFCQLSELLTERKYKTSMERAGKIILKYSSNPGLDVVTFFDITLFSFLIGNADMHLKNFSLITRENGDVGLAPAYDLVSTRLMPIDDPEEMALTVNGRKARLTRSDFEAMGSTLKISQKTIENSFKRLSQAVPKMHSIARRSFLSNDLKHKLEILIRERAKILGLFIPDQV